MLVSLLLTYHCKKLIKEIEGLEKVFKEVLKKQDKYSVRNVSVRNEIQKTLQASKKISSQFFIKLRERIVEKGLINYVQNYKISTLNTFGAITP